MVGFGWQTFSNFQFHLQLEFFAFLALITQIVILVFKFVPKLKRDQLQRVSQLAYLGTQLFNFAFVLFLRLYEVDQSAQIIRECFENRHVIGMANS